MDKKQFMDSHDIKIHSSVVVGTKGQIVIPKTVRDLLNITPGENLMIVTKGTKFIGVIKSSDIEFFTKYLNDNLNNETN